MEITHIETFLDYYEKIRARTLKVIECIPPDKIDWTYQQGKFTFGDLIRHIGAAERYMFAETAQFKKSKYPGHGKELGDGYEGVKTFFVKTHKESMQIFERLRDTDLTKKCMTPAGIEITLWKWLRAMVEHEIHHRGQMYLYLSMLRLSAPPLYGLTSEEVLEKSDPM